MMMIIAAAALVLIHSVNSFALKEKKGMKKKAPVLLGSGKASWRAGVRERVKNVFAAALR